MSISKTENKIGDLAQQQKIYNGRRYYWDPSDNKWHTFGRGRPSVSSKYGEPTVVMRIPKSLVPVVQSMADKMAAVQSMRIRMISHVLNTEDL